MECRRPTTSSTVLSAKIRSTSIKTVISHRLRETSNQWSAPEHQHASRSAHYDDTRTRPMEEFTIKKELNNLKQGKISPQELVGKIRDLEDKESFTLSESDLFTTFTNALNQDLYTKILESEVTDFPNALKKANLLWDIQIQFKPSKSTKEKDPTKKPEFFCEIRKENHSHNTKYCKKKLLKKDRTSTHIKKSINAIDQHNTPSDDGSDHNRERIAALQKQVNELKSSEKENKPKDRKGRKKKWTKEEDEKYFATKYRADYEDYPTVAELKKKEADGDLKDDTKCRFCGRKSHIVSDCEKLRFHHRRYFNRINFREIKFR